MSSTFYDVIDWSCETLGSRTERGPTGPLKHLKKECDEAIADPKDILEFADLQILVWDAAWRAGFTYVELEAACITKLAMLKQRTYLKVPDGEVSEHVKEVGAIVPVILKQGWR